MHSEQKTNPPISTMTGTSRCDFLHDGQRTALASGLCASLPRIAGRSRPCALLLSNGRPRHHLGVPRGFIKFTEFYAHAAFGGLIRFLR